MRAPDARNALATRASTRFSGELAHACDAPAATALREAEPDGGNDTHKMAGEFWRL